MHPIVLSLAFVRTCAFFSNHPHVHRSPRGDSHIFLCFHMWASHSWWSEDDSSEEKITRWENEKVLPHPIISKKETFQFFFDVREKEIVSCSLHFVRFKRSTENCPPEIVEIILNRFMLNLQIDKRAIHSYSVVLSLSGVEFETNKSIY